MDHVTESMVNEVIENLELCRRAIETLKATSGAMLEPGSLTVAATFARTAALWVAGSVREDEQQ